MGRKRNDHLGGFENFNYYNTGARFNPATTTWTPTSTGANVPEGRLFHTAIWTGNEMIVWGANRKPRKITITIAEAV
jgi:hypothetical protein